jgi:glutaredoxin
MAKDWMNANSISYVDYNVGEDQERKKEMIEMTGQLGVPVIKIGMDVMIGFDQEKMTQLLGVK